MFILLKNGIFGDDSIAYYRCASLIPAYHLYSKNGGCSRQRQPSVVTVLRCWKCSVSAQSDREPIRFVSAWLKVTQPHGPRGFWEDSLGPEPPLPGPLLQVKRDWNASSRRAGALLAVSQPRGS